MWKERNFKYLTRKISPLISKKVLEKSKAVGKPKGKEEIVRFEKQSPFYWKVIYIYKSFNRS